ncbi:MAG: hypothetical protein AAGL17_24115 [Cyanobacteria bacterium J06576_12]
MNQGSYYSSPDSSLHGRLIEAVKRRVKDSCWLGEPIDSLILQLGEPNQFVYRILDPQSGAGNFYYYLDSTLKQGQGGHCLVFTFEEERITSAYLSYVRLPPPKRVFPAIDSGVIFLETHHFRDSLTAIVKVNHPCALSLVFYRDKEQPTYQAMMHEVFNELEATRWSLPSDKLQQLESGTWWVLVIQHGGKREEARQWVQLEKQE